jgi:hypothetical protein
MRTTAVSAGTVRNIWIRNEMETRFSRRRPEWPKAVERSEP